MNYLRRHHRSLFQQSGLSEDANILSERIMERLSKDKDISICSLLYVHDLWEVFFFIYHVLKFYHYFHIFLDNKPRKHK